MFLDPNYKRFFKIGDFSPPFGIKSQGMFLSFQVKVLQIHSTVGGCTFILEIAKLVQDNEVDCSIVKASVFFK